MINGETGLKKEKQNEEYIWGNTGNKMEACREKNRRDPKKKNLKSANNIKYIAYKNTF